MQNITLLEIALFLAATVVAAPLAKVLNIGTVLGYLLAGVLIGPYGLGLVYSLYEVESILHFSEFGVVLLLFLIGLELRLARLWAMRAPIFALGGAQVALSGLVLAAACAPAFDLAWQGALFAGFGLSLSSTAFALRVLEEKGELSSRHGRLAFAVLLFQDLAAIPLIALVPFFAVAPASAASQMDLASAAKAIAVIVLVIVVGHFVLDPLYRMIARTRVKEAMTASALLTVIGVALLMEEAGLSAALGAFLAGVLLADSQYRHQIEADIAPFEGLLLGLFFTSIGMSLNLRLIVDQPLLVCLAVVGLIAAKSLILYALGRWQELGPAAARRLGLALSQGGEFAFVLFTAGAAAGVVDRPLADLLSVAVALSMAATPALLLLDEMLAPRSAPADARAFDRPPAKEDHVVIAGFGRFGQIVARVLRAKRIPFTALDSSPEQVDFVRNYGSKIYYGDASRPEILEAAQTGRARAFVLALDDVETSVRTAQIVRQRFPQVPIYARARNRRHVHRLMDLGVEIVQREMFLSALDLTHDVLRGVGLSEREARKTIETFKARDERRLYEDYENFTDEEKMRLSAKKNAEELAEIFAEDAAEEARTEAKQAAE